MTTIANLRVALSAETQGFSSAMSNVRGQVNQLATAAAGVAVGFGAFVQRGLNVADELQKMAIRTGTSVEALSALKHQGELADVSLGTLERGLSRMRRSLGEARDGTKAQSEAFQQLGIDVDAFAKLQPERQLGVLADALNALKDPSEQARIGQELLGRGYTDLLTILQGGSAGMDAAAADAARLGKVLTTDAANGAAEANDAMTRLTSSVGALGVTLATELAPGITKVADVLTERIRFVVSGFKLLFQVPGTALAGLALATEQLLGGNIAGAARTASRVSGDVGSLISSELDKLPAIQERSQDILQEIATNTARGATAQ